MKYFKNYIIKILLIFPILYGCTSSDHFAPIEDKSSIDFSLSDEKRSKEITVAIGDSLYSIAKKEGVSVRAVIDINKLKAPFKLHPGEKIIIPLSKSHIVKKGETLWAISKCYGVDIITIKEINNIDKNGSINVGMIIKIPQKIKSTPSKCLSDFSKDKIAKTDDSNIIITETERSSNYGYIWPVKGKIIVRFGVSSSGLINDGVNILSAKGKPVKAADSGKVVYAGNEIQAFGNLILIKHKNNKTTAYAHLENLKVSRGQIVIQGEIIAHVGNSGKVSVPQLHFELRDNTGPLNPLKYLPKTQSTIN